jgi:hypothetical protein
MGMCVRRLGNGIARALAGDAVRAERQIPVRARAAGTWRLRHGQRLGEPRRGDEREHERKGRFHWFDLFWDTIGTLPPLRIEIVRLFRPVYCCVMGRKAPRKRLARRVMACPTGVPPSTRTSLGAPPTPRFG